MAGELSAPFDALNDSGPQLEAVAPHLSDTQAVDRTNQNRLQLRRVSGVKTTVGLNRLRMKTHPNFSLVAALGDRQ